MDYTVNPFGSYSFFELLRMAVRFEIPINNAFWPEKDWIEVQFKTRKNSRVLKQST